MPNELDRLEAEFARRLRAQESYVTFKNGRMEVDVMRFLASDEGKVAAAASLPKTLPTWASKPLPQPWECPRCHKIHGPMSMSCDCKPKGGGSDA